MEDFFKVKCLACTEFALLLHQYRQRLEESRKWLAEQQARRAVRQRDPFIDEMLRVPPPEKKAQLLAKYGYA